MERLRKAGFTVLCAALIGFRIPASAQSISGVQNSVPFGAAPTCIFGSASLDGCATANQNAFFTVENQYGQSFFQHAATSGQLWSSAHPQPFNVAAVDYPVGYDKSISLKDWLTVAIGSGATTGCSLEFPGSSTGNANNKVPTTNSTLSGTTFTAGAITSGTIYPGLFVGGAGIPTSGANIPVIVSGSGLVWTVTNPGNLNITTPESMWVGGQRIACTVNGSTPTFDGWDFSTGGGAQLRFTGTSGSLTVKNSKFVNGLNSNFGNGYSISSITGTTASLDAENNYFDGANASCTLVGSYVNNALTVSSVGTCDANAQLNNGRVIGGGTLTAGLVSLASTCILSGGAGNCTTALNTKTGGPFTLTVGSPEWKPIVWNSTDSNITIKYNAFVNIPGLNGSFIGTNDIIHVDYNYVDAFDLNNQSTTHTSYFATVPTGGTNVTMLDFSYNVGIYTKDGAGSGTTMFAILGPTGAYGGYVDAIVVGNTAISNLRTNGSNSNSAALLEFVDVSALTGTFTAKDNYVDPSGSLICMLNSGDMTNNQFWVDDGSAGPGSDSGIAGNIYHITGDAQVNRGKVYVGAVIGSATVTYGPVLPYLSSGTTGTGLGGTYAFTGTPRHVPVTGPGTGSTISGKTWDSPVTTVGGTLVTGPANQVGTNMRADSLGEAISIIGTQWNGSPCTGHH